MSESVEVLIGQLRTTCAGLYRWLAREGWSAADIEEINALVRLHRDEGNTTGLQALLTWAKAKRAACALQARAAYAERQAKVCAVAVSPNPVTGIAEARDHTGQLLDAEPVTRAPRRPRPWE